MAENNETKIVKFNYSDRQKQAIRILEEDIVEELLYGGAKGGGKTVLGCRWCFRTAMQIIKDFKLKPMIYPIPVGFMGRKRGADFKKTTLETWKKEIPQEAYTINEQKNEIVIRNSVKIFFGGFDDRQLIEKFNSMELAFYFIDQAEEISEEEYAMLAATLRLKIKDEALVYKGLLSANPAQCWLKNAFVDKNNKGPRRYLKALPTDNPFLPDDYVPRLQRIFESRPERLRAYLQGDWSALAGTNIVIQQQWIDAARLLKFQLPEIRKLVVCDPARFGDDETVIYYFENTQIKDADIFGQKRLTEVAGRCAAMVQKHKADKDENIIIVVDADGLGGGVADDLVSWGYNVIEIHSQSQSNQPDKFINLRAEMWWTAGEKYSTGSIEEGEYKDEELERQLTSVQYDFATGGRIQIESKEEIKSPHRLGRSPDRADARIMGLYGLKYSIPYGGNLNKNRNNSSVGVPDFIGT